MNNKPSRSAWIDVDLDGLRNLLARRGKEFLVYELVQNAWDERPSLVEVSLPRPQRGTTILTVKDDSPEGFRNLTHAFTLFTASYKKDNPQLRGAFNAGEKFVLAFCEEASLISTRGGYIFDSCGRRRARQRTSRGTEFKGILRLTVSEWEEICAAAQKLLPPVPTTFNGDPILPRTPVHTFRITLPTVRQDSQGQLKSTTRQTEIRVHALRPGEMPALYEMGIPVTETGDKWHIDVQQKVPVNLERDKVSPSYLRAIRVAVVNTLAQHLTEADASNTWVREAIGDSRIGGQAVQKVIELRFGLKHVTTDPSDPEANLIAVSKGYNVISPASLSGPEWENVRKYQASLPAGKVTPSPKPLSAQGKPLKMLDRTRLGSELLRFERFAMELAHELIERSITVTFADDVGWGFTGCYGNAQLTINVNGRGEAWFRGAPGSLLERWIPFLIHEFAHEKVKGHLSDEYHRECCRLAGVLARVFLEKPQILIPLQKNSPGIAML